MQKFETLDAIAMPMPQANIDSDQIMPARFLARRREDGLGDLVFHDRRYRLAGDATAERQPSDFVLNDPRYQGSQVLVAGANFSCGSSREHAVCGLLHWGIRVVIAPGIADIFVNNALENGLLAIVVTPEQSQQMQDQLQAQPGSRIGVDLEAQTLRLADGTLHAFHIEARQRRCLLLGLNSIQLTLQDLSSIEAFEARHLS